MLCLGHILYTAILLYTYCVCLCMVYVSAIFCLIFERIKKQLKLIKCRIEATTDAAAHIVVGMYLKTDTDD